MSALLALAISILVLNHWLHAQARGEPEEARTPGRSSVAFSAVCIALTAPIVWFVREVSLTNQSVQPLQFVAAALVVTLLVQIAHRALRSRVEISDALAEALRRRTLLSTNVFGATLLQTTLVTSFVDALVIGALAGIGFEAALQVFGRIMARLERAPIPAAFEGAPIALITAGFMALALLGLKDLF